MSISYSGLTNYGKASLGSVDSWGTNMNILKDPPKGIYTRRIDKVGETSEITAMVDDSENRACESINVYARGVNPMVSVSYGNEGNNGGQRSGIANGGEGGMQIGGQAQAYLPYRVVNEGAFYAPILTQTNLQPLSRQPRIWTTAFTQPGFVDFSKKMKTCGNAENTKEVKTTTLKASVRPTAVYKIDTGIKEPFEVKYVIQPTLKKSYNTALKTTDRTTQHVLNQTKEINNNNIHSFANTNLNKNIYVDINEFNPDRYLQDTNAHEVYTNVNDNKYVNNNEFNPDRYLQDTNAHDVYTNLNANIQVTSIEDILDLSNVKTKENFTIDYTTPLSGNDKVEYIHDNLELNRVLPQYSTTTNIKNNQQKILQHEYMIELEKNTPLTQYSVNPGKQGENNISARQYQLNEKINYGGFEGKGTKPTIERSMNIHEYESDKSKMNKKVESMFNRYRQ